MKLLVPVLMAANMMFVGLSYNGKINPYFRMNLGRSTPNSVNKFRINEAHHLYFGIGVFAAGYLFKNRTLKCIGIVISADDAVQHICRINTPGHMINDKFKVWK